MKSPTEGSVSVACNEFRVIGPPGTGKTTWLCRQAQAALESIAERSLDPFDAPGGILFSSLTRAAADVLRGRGLKVDDEAIGTLHAHAYRALGKPPLCIDAKSLDLWNQSCSPGHRVSVKRESEAPDRVSASRNDEASRGDRLLHDYHVMRSRMRPRELWRKDIAAFADEYETWKRVNGLRDFADVIHDAAELDEAPGNPSIIFVDEAQDHDRAELRLVRKWASSPSVEKLVIVGDPDQNLYEWRGSEPEAFYESAIPQENRRVLAQSYRVPVAVHQAAMEMIGRVKGREPVEYLPKPETGEVREIDASLKAQFVDEVVDDFLPYIGEGKTVMLLTTCEYQLRPLCTELRQRGIAYWNPMARERGGMNPLHPSKGRSACERLLSFLRPNQDVHGDAARVWTPADLWCWLECCEVRGWLKQGAKVEIERLAGQDEQRPLTADQLAEWMPGGVPDELIELDVNFLRARLLSARRPAMTYAIDVYRRGGADALKNRPKVIVGTIHSVKGGEAEVVYLCPDLSPQGFDQYDSRDPAPVYRLMYVGMTRASETLVLCSPSGPMSIDW